MHKHDYAISSQINSDRIEPNRFNVIYCDPPWRFRNWSMSERAKRGEKWGHRNGRSPYDTMTTKDICNLPIENITAKNAILLLWVTDPKLEEGFQVIKAWGFTFKTVALHWIKQNPSGVGFHLGLGYHTRANPEICLLATRGKGLRRVDNTIPRLIISPLQEHSKKPNEAYQRIERLYGNVPRVELFARQAQPEWTAVGNEIDGKDIQKVLLEWNLKQQ